MFFFYALVPVISSMAVSLGVGSSTFALVFYFMATHSPTLHETGRPYQKVVYIVLRVAMVLILLMEILKIGFYMYNGVSVKELLAADVLAFMWTVVAVLFVNPVLMTFHYMPKKIGSAIQATSWYTLGVVSALPGDILYSYLPLVLTYAGCVVAMAVVIELITQKVAPKESIPVADTLEAVVVTVESNSARIDEPV
ncbi:hypothetical protein HY416_04385 [Candidatus Kaiserbacteria bacterium]|nr:hypothetical protein [Candidatus Kaiserbacteria bacterium]